MWVCGRGSTFRGHGPGERACGVWAALEALLLLPLLLAVRECQLETRTISIMERIEEVIECKADEARRGKKEKKKQDSKCNDNNNNNKRHLTF